MENRFTVKKVNLTFDCMKLMRTK